MALKLWGFEIKRQGEDAEQMLPTPVNPQIEDGAINIQTGAHYGIFVDLDGSYRSEVDLLTKYRHHGHAARNGKCRGRHHQRSHRS